MKIAYCLMSIRSFAEGGIERVTVVKSNTLAEVNGSEVYVIVAEDNERWPQINPLSPKVHFVNLSINFYENTTPSRWLYYKRLWSKKKQYRQSLRDTLAAIKPDIIISTGKLEKNILCSTAGGSKIIGEIHEVKWSIEKSLSLFDYLIYWKRYHNLRKYDKVVTLTEESKQMEWANNRNIVVIPNPVSFVTEEFSTLENKRVIAVGRLEWEKNFSSLIRSFRIVADRHPDWTLDIYGNGRQKWQLQRQIEELDLNRNVFLKGFTSDVQKCMLESSCLVLSSLFESFSVVITEAMMCGLPVVSYNCPFGPRSIITEGKDGFLVTVNDEQGMADRICRLIEDEELRRSMGAAAKKKAQKYRVENIIPMWMNLFNRLLEVKR